MAGGIKGSGNDRKYLSEVYAYRAKMKKGGGGK
jgi:hypothetical protein